MPQFGLRHIYAAKYVNNDGTISYTGIKHVGDAMLATIELRFAEGRLYAEDALAEYMRKAVGGTISLGVKYIKTDAQPLLFGTRTKQRTITYQTGTTTATASVDSIVLGGQDEGNYVGVAFYAPDLVDGVKKYTCVLIKKALFGPPSMSLQTANENITFNTPTTSGEFLADDSVTNDLYEIASVDSIAAAEAWVAAVLS